MDADRENPQTLRPTALGVADVARLLGVAEDVVQKHLAEGAPHAADGSMNLVHYAAWLNKRLVTAEPEAKPDGD
jgi:hypothetical protein